MQYIFVTVSLATYSKGDSYLINQEVLNLKMVSILGPRNRITTLSEETTLNILLILFCFLRLYLKAVPLDYPLSILPLGTLFV